MENKINRVVENGVEVKVWPIEYVFNINGLNYVPLPYVSFFTDYSRSRVKGLICSWRVDPRAIMKISNLTFVRRDYIPALQMMYHDPNKYARQDYMIDIYYNRIIRE